VFDRQHSTGIGGFLRQVASVVGIAVAATLLCACARSTEPPSVARPTTSPSASVAATDQPLPPGIEVAGAIRDLSVRPEETASALAAADRDVRRDMIDGKYYNSDQRITDLGGPATLAALLSGGRVFLNPVHALNATATASSDPFADTHQLPGEYVLGIEYGGRMVMATDWGDYGLRSGESGTGWATFYGMNGKEFAEDEKLLHDYFGSTPFRIRYIACDGSWWVVGSNGRDVRAVFEPHDGDNFVDPGSGLFDRRALMEYLAKYGK